MRHISALLTILFTLSLNGLPETEETQWYNKYREKRNQFSWIDRHGSRKHVSTLMFATLTRDTEGIKFPLSEGYNPDEKQVVFINNTFLRISPREYNLQRLIRLSNAMGFDPKQPEYQARLTLHHRFFNKQKQLCPRDPKLEDVLEAIDKGSFENFMKALPHIDQKNEDLIEGLHDRASSISPVVSPPTSQQKERDLIKVKLSRCQSACILQFDLEMDDEEPLTF